MPRILVIEDDPAILRGLADNLADEAHDVLTAADGADDQMVFAGPGDFAFLDLPLVDEEGDATITATYRAQAPEPGELFALDPGESRPRALTSFNAARLAGLDLGAVGEVTAAGAGGAPVHALLVFPPGFDRARKWPLLQVIHGGPHGASLDQFHYRWNGALLASRGHVVAMVNFHGSTGYGQAFAEAILGNHGDRPFADVMGATDHLVGEGYVDEARMAAAGGSYGGYLTRLDHRTGVERFTTRAGTPPDRPSPPCSA